MANISDVYSITFEASSVPLAELLEAYAKSFENPNAYYNLASDLQREGDTLSGGFASGRWTYSSNLEGYFERPEQWCGDDFPAVTFGKIAKLLEAGETISVSYSEDEPGCEVFQDGYGTIAWNEQTKGISVSLDFEEHDRPCDITEAAESGEDNPDGKEFWCYAHECFTNDPDRCEDGV